jgi:uncharacterized protein
MASTDASFYRKRQKKGWILIYPILLYKKQCLPAHEAGFSLFSYSLRVFLKLDIFMSGSVKQMFKKELSAQQKRIVEAAELYVREELGGDSSGHDWWHIERVRRTAVSIAEQENADRFICELAALLHDVADEKLAGSEEAGMSKVQEWLAAQEVEGADSEHVLEIIATMSFKGGKGSPMRTLEGQVVQDADRLDALGAVGIGRTFAYSGAKGQLMYDPNLPARESMTKEQYRNEKSTAINHFPEKLFKLKDRMNTAYARQLAEDRHRFMEEFVARFLKEWDGKR